MDFKKALRHILYPHPAVIASLAAVALPVMIYSLMQLEPAGAAGIASYALSFYALVAACLQAPRAVRWLKRFRRENRYYQRYASDMRLRMNLSLYGGFGFSAAYAVFQLCLGLWHRSVWFYAMALYYLLLAGMRLVLLRHTRVHALGAQQDVEWRKYRLCGACLLAMNLALAVILVYFVLRIRTFRHHEITTIAMAAYTFAAMALAIRNSIRHRKHASPAYAAVKAISLVRAAVSMLTLENAMLTTFGKEGSERFNQMMLGASGIAVILLVQGIALYMLVRAGRQLRRLGSATEHITTGVD